MPSRVLFPLPVNSLFLHPDYVALPAAARGMLLSLVEHVWRTDCKHTTFRDDELFALVRAHRSTWKAHKPAIMRVYADILPDLVAYHHLRTNKATTIRFVAKRGGQARAAQSALEKLQQSHPPPEPVSDFHQLGITPTREPPANRPPPPSLRPQRAIHTDSRVKR